MVSQDGFASIKPVTDKEIVKHIISQLKKGVPPWRKPWADSATGVIIGSVAYDGARWPSNVRAPAIPYGVFNGAILLAQASRKRYRTNLWITEEVVGDLDARVVDKDNRPTAIERYHQYEPHWKPTPHTKLVYNIDQIVDCEKSLGLAFFNRKRSTNPKTQFKRSKKLFDRLVKDHGLEIVTENQAAYVPSWDVVLMPDIQNFSMTASTKSQAGTAEANFWATLWHEVIHWTGHPKRLDRDRHVRWGDKIYAFEELIAELGAAFLCANLGIHGEMQHESYLDSWCRALEQDPGRSLWAAAEYASAAKDFVLKKPEAKHDVSLF